jgi:sugar/nucleoside kinase (ribokinase family)
MNKYKKAVSVVEVVEEPVVTVKDVVAFVKGIFENKEMLRKLQEQFWCIVPNEQEISICGNSVPCNDENLKALHKLQTQ